MEVLKAFMPLVWALLIAMAIDVLMGLFVAVRAQKVNSSVSFSGMTKKCGMLLMVGVGLLLEQLIGGALPVAKLVSLCYLVTEVISILENASALGIPIPAVIVNALDILKKSDPQPPPIPTTVKIDHASSVSIQTPPESASGIIVSQSAKSPGNQA